MTFPVGVPIGASPSASRGTGSGGSALAGKVAACEHTASVTSPARTVDACPTVHRRLLGRMARVQRGTTNQARAGPPGNRRVFKVGLRSESSRPGEASATSGCRAYRASMGRARGMPNTLNGEWKERHGTRRPTDHNLVVWRLSEDVVATASQSRASAAGTRRGVADCLLAAAGLVHPLRGPSPFLQIVAKSPVTFASAHRRSRPPAANCHGRTVYLQFLTTDPSGAYGRGAVVTRPFLSRRARPPSSFASH